MCDLLASAALRSPLSSTASTFLPRASCALLLAGDSITYRIAASIRHHTFDAPFRSHFLASREWPTTTPVDWRTLGNLCQSSKHRTFILKLVHCILPCGRNLNCIDPNASPYCPACGEIESNDHFLTCHHPSRVVKKLASHIKKCKSDPDLCDLLLSAVNSVVTGVPFHIHHVQPAYRHIAVHQSELGLINLLCGIFVLHWRERQETYWETNGSDSNTPGILSVISSVWDDLFALWRLRCDQRHGLTMQSQESKISRSTIAQITSLYEIKNFVMPEDRKLFFPSLAEHLRQPQSALCAWLHNHSDHLTSSHAQALSSNTTHTRSITSYFQ